MACFELITKTVIKGRDVFEFERINSTDTECRVITFAGHLITKGVDIPANAKRNDYNMSHWTVSPECMVFQTTPKYSYIYKLV